ncbi:hypothetical protein NLK61_14475 [Pseudomonas fuscovaginae UPB0736]|uniref:hypothetical protein n=1 Tax=Pseudomonas asplenii TaxID=53407 RepID=UPI0002882D87|nr:hypothetical protein [Pseudomonas fuscovaginae]UUQ67778.1 hypothetical protein NLK61_14475 [Pseudomonas fuscovaginae UPB0736]
MLPKKCNTFPSRQDYAAGLAAALTEELGSTRQAVKTLMRWTDANERTAKNWLNGTTGPRGEYLARLIHHSDGALMTFLTMSAREGVAIAIELPSIRAELSIALEAIDRCLNSEK